VIFLDTGFLFALVSTVDCLSFVIMEKLGIREALAVDSDFTHRFIARPGPQRG
jgi:predicted nucleic acid-binding protein